MGGSPGGVIVSDFEIELARFYHGMTRGKGHDERQAFIDAVNSVELKSVCHYQLEGVVV
jgi:hypothetical protein